MLLSRCGRRRGKAPNLEEGGEEANGDRYHEILFMIDTCQANTMYSKFYSPNIIATGSSEIDESSYSHHADNDVGVAVIDRYTYYNLDFLETQVREPSSKMTLGDLFDSYDESKIHSHPGVRWDLFPGDEQGGRERLVMDFFGNVQNVEVDNAGNDTEWKEDLLLLGKKIAELRERTEAQDAAEKNTSIPDAIPRSQPSRKVKAAKVQVDEKWWGKKAIGAWALAGCSLVWLAGTYLESS
jgi:glycosylphosphatidylinositol transamidase (GPIT) subunit GPI8